MKAGDFLQRRVKGSSQSIAQGEGKDPVWCGQGSPEQGREKLKCPCAPWGMCGSAGIPGCWEGVPEDTDQEHEAELGEVLEGPAHSRTLARHVRLGVCLSPPQGSPAWSHPGFTGLWGLTQCPCTMAAPLSMGVSGFTCQNGLLCVTCLLQRWHHDLCEGQPGVQQPLGTALSPCHMRVGQEHYPALQLPLTTTLASGPEHEYPGSPAEAHLSPDWVMSRRQVSICTSKPRFMLHISMYSWRCRFMSFLAVASSSCTRETVHGQGMWCRAVGMTRPRAVAHITSDLLQHCLPPPGTDSHFTPFCAMSSPSPPSPTSIWSMVSWYSFSRLLNSDSVSLITFSRLSSCC